jgi:type IV pilus assembly protein PilB
MEEGMLTLRQRGLRKVKDGLTTIEEVARETVK